MPQLIKSKSDATRWELFFSTLKLFIGIIRGFLLIPVYLYYIDSSVYGAWLATGSLLGWLQLFDPGAGHVLKQKVGVAVGAKSSYDLERLVSSGFVLGALILVLVLTVGYISSLFLQEILNVKLEADALDDLTFSFQLAVIGTAFTMANLALYGINQGFLNIKELNIFIILITVFGIVTILLLLHYDFGLVSLGFGVLVTGVMMCVLNLGFVLHTMKANSLSLRLDLTYFRKLTGLFSISFGAKTAVVLLERSDLILIARFLGPESVNAYEFTRRPIRILFDLVNRGSAAMMPALANVQGAGAKGLISRITRRFNAIMLYALITVSVCLILLNGALVNFWLGNLDYYLGDGLNVFIVLSTLIWSVTYNYSNITYSLGNIRGHSIVLIVKSILYVVLVLLLLPRLGLVGIVLAMLASTLLTETWYFIRSLSQLTGISWTNLLSWNILGSGTIFLSLVTYISLFLGIEQLVFKALIALWVTAAYTIVVLRRSRLLRFELRRTMAALRNKFV